MVEDRGNTEDGAARAVSPPVLDTLDYAWHRLTARMAGMSAAEYLWEPVAAAWSVRMSPDGIVRADDVTPEPVPAPVTTIAWRSWHIGATCLAEYTIGGLGPWPLELPREQWYLDPADALAAMNTSWQAFRAGLVELGEDGMWRELGPAWGQFAHDTWVALALHALDEIAHHGAEIALLRDLYARR
jgi:hypothetical protein